jgi:bifunctional DNA-binding transcriptional regulator/antitoxin component of YhaV-PrlF toxin-antitoxin module
MKKQNEVIVKVDSRNRFTIPKEFAQGLPHLFRIYVKNGNIVLEPLVELPKEELWLLDPKNKEIIDELKEALKQKGTIKKGSFAKYVKDKGNL